LEVLHGALVEVVGHDEHEVRAFGDLGITSLVLGKQSDTSGQR